MRLQTLHGCAILTAIFSTSAAAQDFLPPAGNNYAVVAAAGSILPGGRLIKPLGMQIETGPGPFGLAVSPKGVVATADVGHERFGVTIVEPPTKKEAWRVGHIWARTPDSGAPEFAPPDWKGVTAGIAFDGEKSVWITEGDSGRIRQIELANGDHGKIISLNSGEFTNSYTTDLAYDSTRHLIYVVDQSNARIAAVDEKSGRVISSLRLDKRPFAIALSPDGLAAWVTEASTVCAIDLHDPSQLAMAARIPAPSPEAILATADRVYVSNALDDSITVISPGDHRSVAEISVAIPTLGKYHGVIPAGMAYDPVTKWLLVAESGINAVAIIDTTTNQEIGLIPAGWTPTRVAIAGDRVYVTNARGRGTGPNPRRAILELGEIYVLHRGSLSTFIMPARSELPNLTTLAFSLNGFVRNTNQPPNLPPVRHVALIVKGGRTFDEVMGDVAAAANGPVQSMPQMAIFGIHGFAEGGRKQFSVQDAAITPNQHEIAHRWAFTDNFYAAGETSAEVEYWLNGGYPDPETESSIRASHGTPAATELWDHLKRNGIGFRNIKDKRADEVIAELKGIGEFPQFLRISLPDGQYKDPDPAKGYPYRASFVAENDLAVGRIVDYLSHSPWWKDMAVFITGGSTQGGLDHVDAHRTLLFAAGPWVKRNYVSHTNSSTPGLIRTIYELLHLPAANLMDATAASLRDLFTDEAEFSAFTAMKPDARIYDPESTR